MPTSTFGPNASGSGRITANNPTWATLRALTTGGAGAGQYILVTGVGFYLYRMFLTFDTSALPNDAIISGWRLKLYRYDTEISYDNKNTVDIHIIPSTQASPTALANDDYDNITFSSKGSLALASFNANNTYFTITGTDLTFIDKSSYTKMCLTTSLDLNNVAPTGSYGNTIGFQNTGGANPPVLEVDYTVPSGGSPMFFSTGGIAVA